jgi:hypothetical protein
MLIINITRRIRRLLRRRRGLAVVMFLLWGVPASFDGNHRLGRSYR